MSAQLSRVLRRVGVGQLTATSDHASNLAAASQLCRQAKSAGACLLCLPEAFSFIGAAAETVAQAEPLDGPRLERTARRTRPLAESRGFHEAGAPGGRVFNTHVVLDAAGATRRVVGDCGPDASPALVTVDIDLDKIAKIARRCPSGPPPRRRRALQADAAAVAVEAPGAARGGADEFVGGARSARRGSSAASGPARGSRRGAPVKGDAVHGCGVDRAAARALVHCERVALADGRAFAAPLPADMAFLEDADARRDLRRDGSTTCFREVHGAADGAPPNLAVDRYGSHLLVQRPEEVSERARDEVLDGLAKREPFEGVYEILDYGALAALCAPLVNPDGGLLCCTTNARKLRPRKFARVCSAALDDFAADRGLSIVLDRVVPPAVDYPVLAGQSPEVKNLVFRFERR
ncbi:S-adenosylmethionine-dependent methyltransferase [Aureococcus anophagefferens]|nr:S-adenosylmethionine-dependent methyltransferase [Aureococcus anophagefferens]